MMRILNDRRKLLLCSSIATLIVLLHSALFSLQLFSPSPAGTTLPVQHRASALVYPTIPLGCSADSLLQEYLSQHDDFTERKGLVEQALHESHISPTARECDLLIPIAYAQQALQTKITLKGTVASQLSKFLSLDIVEASTLLQVITACLSRSMPILQGDKALKVLCLHLRLAFYFREKERLFLCGSGTRTRHGIILVDHKRTTTDDHCALVADTPPDQGLIDSNFDIVMQHFFLHRFAVSKLQGKPLTVSTTSNNTLGVYVSGDGRVSNGGDLFGPLVAEQVLQERNQNVSVALGVQNTNTPPVISIVGSTLQGTMRRSNLVSWGTGIIKNMKVAKLAPTSEILAVRGPKTRDLLLQQQGLNPMIISDPALIARDFDIVATKKATRPLCFVIHGVDRKYASEKCPYCMDRLVNNYNRNPHIILETLSECQRVVSSSLHGCIFSHALGIPALAISLGERITGGDFKYVDYMHSVGITSFQTRVNMTRIWEEKGNLTENDWKRMVDMAVQPQFPVTTEHFYETFPVVV